MISNEQAMFAQQTILQTIEALWGQAGGAGHLAQRIGVEQRTVRRWIADPSIVPAGAWADIGRVIEEHRDCLGILAQQVLVLRRQAATD